MEVLSKLYPLATLAFPLLLTSCYEDFDIEVKSTPVLCINSLITAGAPIEVDLSRTWAYNDVSSESHHSVTDAHVYIYVNGEPADENYISKEGDYIRIEAISPTYGDAYAEVRVPFAPSVSDLQVSKRLINVRHIDSPLDFSAYVSFDLDVTVNLHDSPQSQDYYQVSYDTYGSLDNQHPYVAEDDADESDIYKLLTPGSFDYDADTIFSEHIGVFDSVMGSDAYGFMFFTDRQFSGRTYPLRLRFTECYYSVCAPVYSEELLDCGYTFIIAAVSPSYYNWGNYIWQTEEGLIGDISGVGLGDPFWGYSNVSTGAGIVAARTLSACTVSATPILKEALGL